jgi:hypothetical protein
MRLSLARQLDTPQALLHSDVSFTYFYRPVGLLFWRYSAALAGTDAWMHDLRSTGSRQPATRSSSSSTNWTCSICRCRH